MTFARAAVRQFGRMTRTHALVLACASVAIFSFAWASSRNHWAPASWPGESRKPNSDAVDAALLDAAKTALGQREGTIIVMDPQSGRVRAVVNPQLAFEQAMMPGSTMKAFTALAALRAGLVDTNSRTVCPGRFTGLSLSLACVHENHLPPFTPAQAIAYSCNYYFGTLGRRLGRDQLIETLRPFGLGQPSGVSGNEEAAGTLRPCETGNSARIRAESNHAELQSDCDARSALGESDHIQVTPIQLLNGYAALVNGGHLWQPRVANAADFQAVERNAIPIAPAHRSIITEGMRGAVRYGTARSAHLDSLPLSILGKTGTSMPAKGYRTNGWFVGFASPGKPLSDSSEPAPSEIDLAVLVLLTHSHGADAAAVSKSIFATYANAIAGTEAPALSESTPASKSEFGNRQSIRIHLVTENVTQELPLEDYVLGVMRAEGSMETEPEALKALAIAIRTYALANRGRHQKDGFDFCSTTHCQRFVAGNAGRAMIEAVRSTDGQVLAGETGQPIVAYFSASCGGETANLGTLWGTTPPEYLRGVRDEYCAAGPHATWTDTISRTDLLRALQSDARTNVGSRLDNVVISKRDDTGRAEFIAIEGEQRKSIRGWDFKIIVGRILGWNLLKSSRFEVARAGSSFVFHGHGFGHGLGLCQEGAHVMAQRGMGYQRILEKYFPGALLSHSGVAALPPRSAERLRLSGPSPTMIPGEAKPRPAFSFWSSRKAIGFPHWQDGKDARESISWNADVLMESARSPRLPIPASPFLRAPASPGRRFLTISSEHFRVTYPANVDRRDADLVLNTLETARTDLLHRVAAASISISRLSTLEIRLNESTGDFTSRSGQPWWAAAATKGDRIELQPVGLLKRRGILTSTLRHELVHTVIDSLSHNRAPRWLEEGFAIYLAGEGQTISRYQRRGAISTDELEQRLERPRSQTEMRANYADAYAKVAEMIKSGGEASVWKKIAAS